MVRTNFWVWQVGLSPRNWILHLHRPVTCLPHHGKEGKAEIENWHLLVMGRRTQQISVLMRWLITLVIFIFIFLNRHVGMLLYCPGWPQTSGLNLSSCLGIPSSWNHTSGCHHAQQDIFVFYMASTLNDFYKSWKSTMEWGTKTEDQHCFWGVKGLGGQVPHNAVLGTRPYHQSAKKQSRKQLSAENCRLLFIS